MVFLFTAKENGINFPLIPGIKILTSKRQLSNIPRHFYVDLPEELTERMMETKTKEETVQVGVDWAVKQAVGLLEAGHRCVHFYIMQNTKPFLMMRKQLDKYL